MNCYQTINICLCLGIFRAGHNVVVDNSAVEQNIHTQIQPQHGKQHRAQAAIEGGIVGEIADVIGKAEREQQPSRCAEDSAGHGESDRNAPVGQNGEQHGKK